MNFNSIQASMENRSTFNALLNEMKSSEWLLDQTKAILERFFFSYTKAVSEEAALKNFKIFLGLIQQQILSPYKFLPYHERMRAPFDYYAFGLQFIAPLVDLSQSTLLGTCYLETIQHQLAQGDNVVFLANHQIEADPQALSLLLDPHFPEFAEKIIFVAGERVVTDPLAIPFSLGRDLLCIYSKRYINYPPEKKRDKFFHNQRTMEKMALLLQQGQKVIYVAPSGGRDRLNSKGIPEVAPFDPSTIELFFLMAQQSLHPTHFYPMSLLTYDLLPPPKTVQIELGENREVKRSAIHLAIAEEFKVQAPLGAESLNKKLFRQSRAEHIWGIVNQNYQKLLALHHPSL
ncbi:MAG: 1-acyl-sn-glycerol-3-phosphate acyltransferase [Candidatus Rhabdochlamydia sp.]